MMESDQQGKLDRIEECHSPDLGNSIREIQHSLQSLTLSHLALNERLGKVDEAGQSLEEGPAPCQPFDSINQEQTSYCVTTRANNTPLFSQTLLSVNHMQTYDGNCYLTPTQTRNIEPTHGQTLSKYLEAPVPRDTNTFCNSATEIQREFYAIKDSLQEVKLHPELKVHDSRQGVKRSDQTTLYVISRCARYSETALRWLATQEPGEITGRDLNRLFDILNAEIVYLQGEYSGLSAIGATEQAVNTKVESSDIQVKDVYLFVKKGSKKDISDEKEKYCVNIEIKPKKSKKNCKQYITGAFSNEEKKKKKWKSARIDDFRFLHMWLRPNLKKVHVVVMNDDASERFDDVEDELDLEPVMFVSGGCPFGCPFRDMPCLGGVRTFTPPSPPPFLPNP